VFIDGQKVETAKMPTDFTTRKHDVTWKYNLPNKKHTVRLVWTNPQEEFNIKLVKVIMYSDKLQDYSL
jgi:hypothetical protein